jgi:hypothetical protein
MLCVSVFAPLVVSANLGRRRSAARSAFGITTPQNSSSLHRPTCDRRHIPFLANFLTTRLEKNWVTR